MKIVRMFWLHFQRVFVQRSRSLVWFILAVFESGLVLLFWLGALKTNHISGITVSSITSYYLFLAMLSGIITSHIEDEVARDGIRDGQIIKYLMRPVSYYWIMMYYESPYRILQVFYAVILLVFLLLFFGKFFLITTNPLVLGLSFIVAICAYLLWFTYKMILGIAAFWLIDIGGLFQLQDIIVSILAGSVIPLQLFPQQLTGIVYAFPFAYMLYFPIVAFQGQLNMTELLHVIVFQLMWLCIFVLLYQILWKKGLQRFSGVGQ